MVILGLIVYFCHSTRMSLFPFQLTVILIHGDGIAAEQEGKTDIRVPSYVTRHEETVLEDSKE